MNSVPKELWTKVCDIVQKVANKTIRRKRNARVTVVIRGGFTNSWRTERSEKQGEAEKHIQLSAESQRSLGETGRPSSTSSA